MKRHMSKPYLTVADRVFVIVGFVGIVPGAMALVAWAVDHA